jgi:hypothetical protein
MIGQRVECGTRATAIAFSWGDVLRPDAASACLSFGCHMANFAPERERENIDDDEGKVPGQQANVEGGLEDI